MKIQAQKLTQEPNRYVNPNTEHEVKLPNNQQPKRYLVQTTLSQEHSSPNKFKTLQIAKLSFTTHTKRRVSWVSGLTCSLTFKCSLNTSCSFQPKTQQSEHRCQNNMSNSEKIQTSGPMQQRASKLMPLHSKSLIHGNDLTK